MPDYNSNDNRAPWRKHALLIKKAVIGSGVEGIGLSAFLDCTALETFDVSPDNQHLVSVDGVVFSSDMTLLEVCPATKSGSYTIPLSVESIEYCAFADCTELSLVIDEAHEKYALGPVGELMSKDKTQLHWVPESITGEYLVPKGTEIMAYGATYGFRGTEIFIPESVTKIENYNFAYCSALTDITLMGNTPPQLPEEHLERFWGTDKGNVTLHVPAGKKSAYEYAGYAGFKEVKEDATWPDPTSRGIQGQ